MFQLPHKLNKLKVFPITHESKTKENNYITIFGSANKPIYLTNL